MELICVIRGRVQQVGYRAWAQRTALERGVAGWVRNRRDGTVEAMFSGLPEAVEGMIESCRQGPPGARVVAIEQRASTPADHELIRPGERFTVLPTA
jgi:acylphosphatase